MRLSSLDRRIGAADTVVFLDLPRRSCLAGILRRRLHHRGAVDPATGVADRIDAAFLRWVWRFPRLDRPRILEALAAAPASTAVVTLRSRCEARAFLAAVGSAEISRDRHDPVPLPCRVPRYRRLRGRRVESPTH